MKAVLRFTLVFLWFLIARTTGFTQTTYNFHIDHSPFQWLEGDSIIAEFWNPQNSFDIPLGFSFKYFGIEWDTVSFEPSGRLVFDAEHLFFADPFTIGFLQSGSDSKISVKRVFSKKDSCVCIQVRNGVLSSDSSLSCSFRVSLCQTNGLLKAHIGDHSSELWSVKQKLGPYSGVYWLSSIRPVSFGYGNNILDVGSKKDTAFNGPEPGYLDFGIKDGLKSGTLIEWLPLRQAY